ncbi:MAG TPA: translation elongation factor Ts, partial [Alphaproteobacteria bacterium]|nr:translation elongation factor Ts [Alphaproteobacteria bacterium]
MTISASAVKDLREMTGAGMMDCKKALTETNGDIEAAVDWLRKKGLASAAKKAGRVAAEGLVAIAIGDKSAGMVEVNIETDFAAKNEKFVAFTREMADAALKDGQAIVESDANKTKVTELVAGIGENANLRRAVKLSVPQGAVAGYIHAASAPNLGRIGVLVALESAAPADKLAELGKQIAMHIAAAKPEALSRDQVDSSALERERAVLTEQAKASGKPDAVIEKMVEGRIKKFYEETVLLEQQYVITGEGTVQEAIDAKAKELGAPIKLTAFTRFALGEGIEKEETDFAAEV